MPFYIISKDITKLETDAIVNAANSRLLEGGGVCGAIFRAAGAYELQKECDKIGYCATGEAVITKGYALKAKYIIHTVGPIYGKDPAKEEAQLYSCYKKSLELAKENGLSSIAFPLISSGIYGYPKEEALKVAKKAIKDFLSENEMFVYLIVFNKNALGINGSFSAKLKNYIKERLTAADENEKKTSDSPEEAERFAVNVICESLPEHSGKVAANPPIPGTSLEIKDSLDELINKKEETFSEMLLRLIDEKGMTDVEVYKRANIDRKLFSKIRKKDYVPKKATAMALIIALKLDMNEAEELLLRAGYAFSKSRKFDIIIEFFIENGIYDIFEINDTLFSFDEPLLGAC